MSLASFLLRYYSTLVVKSFDTRAISVEAIPNAKLVYFEISAHGLVEEMEKVIHVLLDFLTES